MAVPNQQYHSIMWKRFIFGSLRKFFGIAPRTFVKIAFGDIWKLRNSIQTNLRTDCRFRRIIAVIASQLAVVYWESYGSWVGPTAIIESPPCISSWPRGGFCE